MMDKNTWYHVNVCKQMITIVIYATSMDFPDSLFLSPLSLAIHPNHPSLPAGPQDFIMCLNRAVVDPIYPTPSLGQDMTQGQFLSGV